MVVVRRARERGRASYGWLDTRFTFSFADYYDPNHLGFRALRVINEDQIAPKGGFPFHSHREMEIITYVIAGSIEHRDSLGNVAVVRAGEVQRMSAGTGVKHSEFNPSRDHALHLLQIWVEPGQRGLEPSYEQRALDDDRRRDRLWLVASSDGRDGSITVHQDVGLYSSLLSPSVDVTHALAAGRHAWVQLISGRVEINGAQLASGDGVALSDEPKVSVRAINDTHLLLFDLA